MSDPQIVEVELSTNRVVMNPRPLPVIANETILAFLKASFTPEVDWEWEKVPSRYIMKVDAKFVLDIKAMQFKNSTLQDQDVTRYQKLITKRISRMV